MKLIKDLDNPIEGKNIIVVEDILDTGLTLSFLRKLFLQHHPKTLRIATLLDKPSRRLETIDADYVGFSIPNLVCSRDTAWITENASATWRISAFFLLHIPNEE